MNSVKNMVIQMYIEKLSDVGVIDVKMNLESWVPTQEDTEYVIKDMENLAISQIEDCDEPELAEETYELIRKIKDSQNINEKRNLMQDHLTEMFWSVPVGLMRKYYPGEYSDFIEKALGIEYVVMGETFTRL